jgi:hypothetical protein
MNTYNDVKPFDTQFGTSATADFQEGTWTFEMDQPFKVRAGRFAIVDLDEYNKLIGTLQTKRRR